MDQSRKTADKESLSNKMGKFIEDHHYHGALVEEIRNYLQDLKTSDEPKVLADELCENLDTWFDDVKGKYAKFDLGRWANIVFLHTFLRYVGDYMLDEDFDPNDIYETDDWKEFIKDRIEFFYNHTNFLQCADEFFDDMLG